MAKQEKLEVADFKTVERPKSEPKLKFGEVLVEDVATGETFITNEYTATTVYSDEAKFKIKKKG